MNVNKLLHIKVVSAKAVCCIFTLVVPSHTNFSIQANIVDLDQTASSLGPHCLLQ